MFALGLSVLLGIGIGTATLASADEIPTPAPVQNHIDASRPIEIAVERGYHPNRIVRNEGEPVRLAFLRKEYSGCTREVVFPTLDLRRELPTGEEVVIDLGTPATGEIPFHCGMHMIHGVVVIEPKE